MGSFQCSKMLYEDVVSERAADRQPLKSSPTESTLCSDPADERSFGNGQQHKRVQQPPSQIIRGWLPEILSQIGAMLSLLAIVLILWHADGKPPEEMFLGMNLNTVLAFLTSLTKVAFMVPIAEGLAQLKWMWFLSSSGKKRPLLDFQLFDDAMRGGVAGVRLFFEFKGILATFGALIMISGIFTSTLTQQAVAYDVGKAKSNQPNDSATLARATSFSLYDGTDIMISPYDPIRAHRAIFDGMFTAPTETLPELRPNCSSGDCSWEPYGSLAACGGVVNLTAVKDQPCFAFPFIKRTTEERLRALINVSNAADYAAGYGNLYLATEEVFPIVVAPLERPTGMFNHSVTELIISDSFIAYTDEMVNKSSGVDPLVDIMSKVKYLEVAFWWCTKTYETEVHNGQATTRELATFSKIIPTQGDPIFPRQPNQLNVAWDPRILPCYEHGNCKQIYGANKTLLEPAPGAGRLQDEVGYSVHLWTGLVASMNLASKMLGCALVDSFRSVVASNGDSMAKVFAFALFGDLLNREVPPPQVQMAYVTNIVDNTARSITNAARELGTRTEKLGGIVHGTVFTSTTFVKVHWEWIALLVAQLGLTAVFLVLTIVTTYVSQVQIIKSSSLATLCALDDDTRQNLGGVGDGIDELGRKAKKLEVHLERKVAEKSRERPVEDGTAGSAKAHWAAGTVWLSTVKERGPPL
ncbi:hypothetical protein QBC35DRAFT_506964 [Podospora australis]|uniref:Uncharacterized protein n=1 Tax=Podospora australis TaxID=1536484 RepID=A0AAN6WPE8_9PEZI|nr:hypothetical protein QBC35DRAFT_506964 [Podospora australis]